MKFYNREKELKVLDDIYQQSKKSACFTLLIGRRRIGKTSLLMESMKKKKCVYLFVTRKSEQLLCAQFQKEIEAALDIKIYGQMTQFRDVFGYLMLHALSEHITLIIDEFQEIQNINPSIFGDIQNLWDQHKNRCKINFIACGSIYSMMIKIFEDAKEPLFGRATSKIVLRPFTPSIIKQILIDYNPAYQPEDLLCLYMLTGGIPKYIELLMEAGATTKDKMLSYVGTMNSVFISEGKDLLISEFGKDYGIYFSILQLIASGKNKLSEINSILEKNVGAYLVNLEQKYSIIAKHAPIFSKPGSRNNRWKMNDNYLQFWFRFIFPNQMLIETGREEALKEVIEKKYKRYSGRILERYFQEQLKEKEILNQMGSFWDRKGENEIDIVAMNTIENKAFIVEVKRKAKKISIPLLEQKSQAILPKLEGYKINYLGLSMEDM